MMKVAALVDPTGQVVAPQDPGLLRVYERVGDDWVCSQQRDYAVAAGAGMGQVRSYLHEVSEWLGDCRVVAAGPGIGFYRVAFGSVGVALWPVQGSPEQFVDQIVRFYSQPIASKAEEEPEEPATVIEPVPERPGHYRVDLREAMTRKGVHNSRRVLLPFFSETHFVRLDILCDHVPKWFDYELADLGLRCTVESLPDITRVHVTPKAARSGGGASEAEQQAPLTPVRKLSSDHPCFDEAARARSSRVHLPVAPRCNVQCNYCNRKFDCVSESRPGVSSVVLTPGEAADYVDVVKRDYPNLAVVGIAGPGDPFANAGKTLETFRLVRERHPELLLCTSSNGLELPRYLDEVAELGISHLTVTMNTVDPEIGGRIYRWVRDGRQIHRGREAGELLLSRQIESIKGLVARGVTVKVNTVLVPGVTLDGVAEVAELAKRLGADVMNNVPLYPVEGTPFGELAAPSARQIAVARAASEVFLPQMTHCQRCRADAVGLLGEENGSSAVDRLLAAKRPSVARPYVAVCTREGLVVDEHLGVADFVGVYENADVDGRVTPRLVERRRMPEPGGGARRWALLAGVLRDCRALVTCQVGESPRMVLQGSGVDVYEAEGPVVEALTDVFAGRRPRRGLPARDCATSCAGPGTGCD